MFGVPDELPDDVDPRLAFLASHCGGDDYLYDAGWHTFPGRMAAYCPHRGRDYRISAYEYRGTCRTLPGFG
jgi:hypothetical protein